MLSVPVLRVPALFSHAVASFLKASIDGVLYAASSAANGFP
jgi:hypothetical protein